ncbi:MAG: hypothetical protein ABJC60_04235 [Actinomycetota bacterium]
MPHMMNAGGSELLVEGLVVLVIGACSTPLMPAFITSAHLEARAASEGIDPRVLASSLRAKDPS